MYCHLCLQECCYLSDVAFLPWGSLVKPVPYQLHAKGRVWHNASLIPSPFSRAGRGALHAGKKKEGPGTVSLSPDFWGLRFFRNLSAQNDALKWAWSYLKLALQC